MESRQNQICFGQEANLEIVFISTPGNNSQSAVGKNLSPHLRYPLKTARVAVTTIHEACGGWVVGAPARAARVCGSNGFTRISEFILGLFSLILAVGALGLQDGGPCTAGAAALGRLLAGVERGAAQVLLVERRLDGVDHDAKTKASSFTSDCRA